MELSKSAQDGSLEELVNLVQAEWREEFRRFIETGDASESFLAFLDTDVQCQKLIERAFALQLADLDDFANALDGRREDAKDIRDVRRAESVSASMALAFEDALEIPAAQRPNVVRRAVDALTRSIRPERQPELKAVVSELDKELTGS